MFALKKTCGKYTPVTPAPTPLNGGTPIGAWVTALAISPDNSYIAIARYNWPSPDSFNIYKQSGDQYPYLTTATNNATNYMMSSAQFSPDGNYILAVWGGAGATPTHTVIFQRTGDVFTRLDAGFLPATNPTALYSSNGNFIFVPEGTAWGYGPYQISIYRNNGATVTPLSILIVNPDVGNPALYAGGPGSDVIYLAGATKTITAATNANPGVITSAGHGFNNGDYIYINQMNGMNELNDQTYIVANATANTLTLQNPALGSAIDTTAYSAYVSGGTIYKLNAIGSTEGFRAGWFFSPDGRILILAAGDNSTLFRVDANGVPTLAAPNPLAGMPLNQSVWLSDTVFAAFYSAWGDDYYSVIQINNDNTITYLQPWTVFPGGHRCGWNGTDGPANISMKSDKSEIVVKCGGLFIWNVAANQLSLQQYIDPSDMPAGYGNGYLGQGVSYVH